MSDAIRRLGWRLGRKLYCWARGDIPNNPARNGEYWLLKQLIHNSVGPITLLDVGANIGDWTLQALTLGQADEKRIQVYAFEPCTGTREILRRRLSAASEVECCPVALSSAEGEADFFSSAAGLGTNSLSCISGPERERVRVTTVDRFFEERRIGHVTMMKIDAEGFDLAILNGATQALADGKIEVVQFEYSWRWIPNKASLRDVFGLIEGTPYRFGKLAGRSMEFFDRWHFELDRYFENNYVLVRKTSEIERLGRSMAFDSTNSAVPTGYSPNL